MDVISSIKLFQNYYHLEIMNMMLGISQAFLYYSNSVRDFQILSKSSKLKFDVDNKIKEFFF